jgi:cell division protein FtsI/penicillin-binding protein 2
MFSLILLRLFYWQVIQNDMLTAKAEGQRFLTKETVANRGEILFSDGSVLVSSEPAYLLFAQPKIINQTFLPKTEVSLESLNNQDMEKIVKYKKEAALKLATLFKDEDKKLATKTATVPATPEEDKLELQEREDYFFNLLNKLKGRVKV